MAKTIEQEIAAAKAASAAKKAAADKAAAAAKAAADKAAASKKAEASKSSAAKQKEADLKLLAQAQALLAKQKATLAALEKSQAEYRQSSNPAKTYNERVIDAIKTGTQGKVNVDAYLPGTGTNLTPEQIEDAKVLENIRKGLNPDGTPKDTKEPISKETRDAFALLEEAFKLYGLESLVPVIRGYMEEDFGVEQAKLKLKTEQAYKDRFKGNELRRSKGLNVLSEDAYLELENDYSETLRSYGLSDYFGVATDATSRLARQQKIADVIGNDISATEFKDRISTVVTRVNMADANTKTALKALYNIGDDDLVKYFLNPAEGSARLKEKVTAAEISAASMTQGLGQTSLGTAEELARLGIDRAEALAGYSKIAAYLPTTEKLSAIYKGEGITYNKATGEEEEFKGLASAKRKRQRLIERETSTFSGSSGTSQVSLKTRTAGQI
jgi:hypothetical protein